MNAPNPHNTMSSYREAVLRHLFVGEVLRELWLAGKPAEVLLPEVDDSGYDVVIESGRIIRHIQLKASHSKSSTRQVPLNIRLADKPSGCVVWTIFDEQEMRFEQLLWYGAEPGQPIPGMTDMRIGKHSKANAEGVKAERPAIRILTRSRFEVLGSIELLIQKLFGPDSDPVPTP